MRTRAVNARGLASLLGSAIAAAALCGMPAASPAVASPAVASPAVASPAVASPAVASSSVAHAAATGASAPSSPASSGAWSRLWWNRDQQGERLLESGDAAGAAQRFRDPQRRAYADLQARRYAEAAQLLAPFKDPESQYNRGNALARAGQLQAALAAYDAALAQAPGDRDARHNRDLVAHALKQQPRSSQQDSQDSQGSQGSQGSQQGSQQGSAAGTPGGSPSAGSASGGGANQPHAGQSGTNQSRGQGAGDQTRAGQSGSGRAGTGQAGTGQAAAAPSEAAAGGATSGSAGQTGTQKDTRNGSVGGPLAQAQRGSAGTATPQNRPPSEQALSLDQWLRRLPDDPGGLLRRKFLIEHLMRQQDQQDQRDQQQGTQ